MRKQVLDNGRNAAWIHERDSFKNVVSGMCFLNDLSGDVHAHVTRPRHSGDEKNCT
jgi:hypothetical protein